MKKVVLVIFFLAGLFFCPLLLHAGSEPTVDDILLKADEIRNPQLDYATFIKITSFKPGRQPQEATYEVMIKGRDRAVVKTLSPPIDKGRILLMLSKDLWAYLPDVSKPLRISLQERLLGEVANGDIARVNFSGDYTPQIIKEDTIEEKEYYVLNLTAKTEDVTYSRVVLWIEKQTFYLLKAEFFAISGRLLKTCSYERYKKLAGKIRPTKLIMNDPILEGQSSIIEYDNMEVKPLPEKYFTKDYMKKFTD